MDFYIILSQNYILNKFIDFTIFSGFSKFHTVLIPNPISLKNLSFVCISILEGVFVFFFKFSLAVGWWAFMKFLMGYTNLKFFSKNFYFSNLPRLRFYCN